MKRILALALALVIVLSLCACGSSSAGNTGETPNAPAGNNDSTDNATPDSTGSNTEETGYVGTWKVIPLDDNSFPPLYLVLNEDGTAGWGAKLDKLQPYFWYECEREDAQEGQMELAREDNMGYGDIFYLTEDGRLYMEKNMSVEDRSYDHIYFERQ